MVVFERFNGSDLFLPQAGISDPATVRVGLLLADAGSKQSSFTVSSATWTSAFYVFFVPSAKRDWKAFAARLRALFMQTSGTQFAFVTETESSVTAASSLVVSTSGGSTTLFQPAQFKTLNVTLNVQAPPMNPPAIDWDDLNNQFTLANLSGGSATVSLTVQGAVSGSYNQLSLSQNLLLPLTGRLAGCVNSAYTFALDDLDTTEAGLLYFAPPPQAGYPLTALRYPLVGPADTFAPGNGADAPGAINLNFWFDVLAPLDPLRTYLQMTDATLGAYFASANGEPFTLKTTASGDPGAISRFVFANRPVQSVEDRQNFYLCPAGTFALSPVRQPARQAKASAADSGSRLLCGISGTEFFFVSAGTSSADTLTFVPNQPAYASYSPSSPTQLEGLSGNTVTAWVAFGTDSSAYVSQPQEAPLYEQDGTSRVSLQANGASAAHLLNFLPLPTWLPPKKSTGATAPAVPLVPYAGIPSTTDLTPFRAMETAALNPTRRNAMMAAQHNTTRSLALAAHAAGTPATFAMTPQGLLAGLTSDEPPAWTSLQMALSASGIVQLTEMEAEIQSVFKQNRIFLVDSTLTGPDKQTLFQFAGADQQVNISDWIFNLSPDNPTADPNSQPVLIFKFWDGQTISDLVDDTSLWSSPDIFNTTFSADDAQTFLKKMIQDAQEAVEADPDSIYANFYNVVTDASFAGILAINGSLQLDDLPTAIQAVMGGMTRIDADGKRVSNLDQFRAHHIGIQINDTDPNAATPSISQSSFFALVDYEKPSDSTAARHTASAAVTPLGFEVEYLRALFTNSELRDFDCLINLMINQLFDVGVTLDAGAATKAAEDDDDNIVQIRGTYQNHSSGDGDGNGEGIYSFVAEKTFDFTFGENAYLKSIELTKLQFSFQQSGAESGANPQADASSPTHIQARFSLWGSIAFNELDVLDLFSFEALSFADLGIGVSFDITIKPPTTTVPVLTFSPGDLRLDLGQTKPREGSSSLLSLLPFRLTSFMYSQNADQTLESLNYFTLGSVPGISSVADTFNYALTFDLDLGSAGALVGSLAAFKFGFLLGWLNGGGVAFGVQMPEADGKLEIKIQGVFDLLIEQFVLKYVDTTTPPMLVVGMINTTVEILGKRLPPSGNVNFVLFKPQDGEAQIGWMFAYDNTSEGGGGDDKAQLKVPALARLAAKSPLGDEGEKDKGKDDKDKGEEDDDSSFNLKYLGLGQRVGPDPTAPPSNFADFLSFMTTDFIESFSKGEYDQLYHADGQWLIVADIQLLKILELGFVFYDVTPFYSLSLDVVDLFKFEITYTKVTDTIGLYFANLTLPEKLRTFQAGAASLTLPALEVSIYTNGNWKVNLGFPNGDDWSGCFRLEFMAGPVPVTGSGGFYLASLSSAVFPVFQGDYPSILAFGLAARIGVGKDFTAGPLSAGVSITFFGIIEGAAGYLASGSTDIFREPNALKLSGQFGLIGEIYGSIDFVIIKASVNVTLSASVGIVLYLESGYGDGSILLYIEATVSVSVSVSISLVFFSITISFSFNATFRFQWQLVGSSQQAVVRQLAYAPRLLASAPPAVLPLLNGFTAKMPLWFLPELTVRFADMTQPGVPQLAFGLALEFDPSPKAPTYASFKPFEALATQLTTWALMYALQLPNFNSPVDQDKLRDINSQPDDLIGFLTYDLLLAQIAVFSQTTITVPAGTQNDPQTASAAIFPMLPFLQLSTSGRLQGAIKADLTYIFSAQNLVSQKYLADVDAYLEQLFVNAAPSKTPQTIRAAAETNIPLAQQMFVEYFSGLIRGAVNQLLQTMENAGNEQQALDQLLCDTVAAGGFAGLGGQMSSMFRSGTRLPFVPGLTIPGATPDPETNPLQSLLWQQFPVGNLSPVSQPDKGVTAQYLVQLAQPDSTQTWISSAASYALTNLVVDPYTGLTASQVTLPQPPALIPFTNSGPQSFSFANRTQWTQGSSIAATLATFPPALLTLSGAQTGSLAVLVQSRKAGQAYAPDGQPLASSDFSFATTVQLVARRVPDGSGSNFLPNVYAISGSSQADQALLAEILQALGSLASIQVLYQTEAGATGLMSAPVNNTDVFVLRTNTTTVSVPPVQLFAALAAPPVPTISVGANLNDPKGFLQILEEVSITNAPGYYLYYKSQSGGDLPPALFNAGPAPITILIGYKADSSSNTPASPAKVMPYHNTLLLQKADPSLVYYATTVDAQFDLQYAAVAAGSVGAELVRSQSSTLLQARDGTLHTAQDVILSTHRNARDVQTVYRTLAESGAAPAQLNSLYNLLTFQVQASAGFIQSNVSAPVQPQAEANADSAAPRTFRAFVPLYAVATANQAPHAPAQANRYASLGDSYTVNFALTDAFGNQHPRILQFAGKNLYFDSIVALDEWQGVVPTFDFSNAAANALNLTLTPSKAAFDDLSKDQAAAALALYQTISTQINAPGVSFSVVSSLSLAADGSYSSVLLSREQCDAVRKLVSDILTYLQGAASGTPPAWNLSPVTMPVTLPGTVGPLPPAFGLIVQFSVQRDISLIDPSLIGAGGVIKLPSAQRVTTTVAPAAMAQSARDTFAENFATAFPALLLAIGLGGAQNLPKTAGARQRALLRKTGQAADPAVSTGDSGTRALWAIARTLVEITIDNPTTHQPYYSSPKPLLNALESGVVPMPAMPTGLAQLGKTQTFVDVDLDVLNRSFFAAVDQVLQPASAAALFAASSDAYVAMAFGRERLAIGYSQHEVDWLFGASAPFTGSGDDLKDASSFIEQQCRAALLSAYSIDTVLQFPVSWSQALPAGAAGNLALFGTVQPVSSSASRHNAAGSSQTTYPCAQIEVPAAGSSGLFTFAYCSPNVVSDPHTPVTLQFTMSHVQVFTGPDPGNDQARPSLWLQLITPPSKSNLPSLTVPVGPKDTQITIPVVLRQYPTPPTLLAQAGTGTKQQSTGEESLQQAAAWIYSFRYQAQLTSYDQLVSYITWNTAANSSKLRTAAKLDDTTYTLFEALCRFSAAFPILQPVLSNPRDANYAAAAAAFASLVKDVAGNSDWNPAGIFARRLSTKKQAQDRYLIQDVDQNDGMRQITLTWDKKQSSMPGGTLAIAAVLPNGTPYEDQRQSSLPSGIRDIYTPTPPIVDNWVAHELSVSGIDVLTAENARPAVQIERNRITLDSGSTTWNAKDEFVYMTPLVQPTQPVTPFLDNSDAVDVAKLTQLAPGTACSSSAPATLCQRIYNLLLNLLTISAQEDMGSEPASAHRLKVGCSFSYPLTSAAGLPPANDPMMPLVPVVFARSFDVQDADMQAQLGAFALAFSTAIQTWTTAQEIVFGPSATPAGGQLVFDVTLFAQLSQNSRPLLRLRNLQLALGDVEPPNA